MARGTSLKKADITFGSCMVLTYPLADPANLGLHFLDGDFKKKLFLYFFVQPFVLRLSKDSKIVYCIFILFFKQKIKELAYPMVSAKDSMMLIVYVDHFSVNVYMHFGHIFILWYIMLF